MTGGWQVEGAGNGGQVPGAVGVATGEDEVFLFFSKQSVRRLKWREATSGWKRVNGGSAFVVVG